MRRRAAGRRRASRVVTAGWHHRIADSAGRVCVDRGLIDQRVGPWQRADRQRAHQRIDRTAAVGTIRHRAQRLIRAQRVGQGQHRRQRRIRHHRRHRVSNRLAGHHARARRRVRTLGNTHRRNHPRVGVSTNDRRCVCSHRQRATDHGAATGTCQRSGVYTEICPRQRFRQRQGLARKYRRRSAVGIEFVRGAGIRIERVDDRCTTTHRHRRIVIDHGTCPLLLQRQGLGDARIGVSTGCVRRAAADGDRAAGCSAGQRAAASTGQRGGVHRSACAAAKGLGRQGYRLARKYRDKGAVGRRWGGRAEGRVVGRARGGCRCRVSGAAVGTPGFGQAQSL